MMYLIQELKALQQLETLTLLLGILNEICCPGVCILDTAELDLRIFSSKKDTLYNLLWGITIQGIALEDHSSFL